MQAIFTSPIRLFIVLAGIFGLLFIILTPPLQTPDESAHFLRSYQISTGRLAETQYDKNHYANSTVGGQLPKSIQKTFDILRTEGYITSYKTATTREALHVKGNSKDLRRYSFGYIAMYPPTSYIPQVLGVLTARILHLPPVMMIYFARCFNLAAYIVLFALAIKIIPIKKWAMFTVGLLPMALFQATSLSADVLTITMTALLVAQVLYYKTNRVKALSHGRLALLFVTTTLLAMSKTIMVVLLPLVFLLPDQLLGSKKRSIITKVLLIVFPVLIFMSWLAVGGGAMALNGSSPNQQILFIIERPFSYLHVLYNTYFFTYSDNLVRSLIGNFGWLDAPVPEFAATIGYIALAVALFCSPVKQKLVNLSKRDVSIFLVLAALYFIGVSTALYAYYTPLKFTVIEGLQGRYYIPAIFLIMAACTRWQMIMSEKLYARLLPAVSSFLLLISTITIYCKYY